MDTEQIAGLIAKPYRYLSEFGYDFPNGLLLAWLACGPVTQLAFDLDTDRGADDWTFWWLSGGRNNFPGISDELDHEILQKLHLQHLTPMARAERIQLTSLLSLIYRHRADVQASIDLHSATGTDDMWRWWLAFGMREYFGRPDRLIAAQAEALDPGFFRKLSLTWPTAVSQTEPDRPDSLKDLLPASLAIVRLSRPDLQAAFKYSEDGVSDLVFWWLTCGRAEFADLRIRIDQDLLQSLHLDFLPTDGSQAVSRLTPLLGVIHAHEPDLRSRFDVATPEGSAGIWQWWFERGEREMFGLFDEQTRGAKNGSEPASIPPFGSKPGVCLFGYARAEFGLGEDIRLLRAALDEANIANVVIKAPWQIAARQSIDEPALEASGAGFDSDIMFYVMPPFDTVTLLCKIGSSAFSARRKIGFWQWELERFPVPAKLAMDLVDEIWCHSEHAATAFRQATDKPVIKVPLPVSVPDTGIASRAAFGLPGQAFVVFTSFDGASSIARKNPLGAILAFQCAFPVDGSVDARLIVKAMNTNNDSLWRECLRKAAVDERIVIIDTVLDRDAYYRLLRACDAVISLHRAEGFGRLMAEAMALGIPVIASRYSGNLDFMTDENSWLIDGDLIAVLAGDYAFHQGQRWLEPNIDKAAHALRECATDGGKRRHRAALGLADIASKHNLKTCGEVYTKLLDMDPRQILSTARRQCVSM